ncbi:MAG: hypothetical protein KAJ11_11130 [Alphaproteobacteria bacterium]|nr:hypothetical protein [Alphaproteobacteria bacterium]
MLLGLALYVAILLSHGFSIGVEDINLYQAGATQISLCFAGVLRQDAITSCAALLYVSFSWPPF